MTDTENNIDAEEAQAALNAIKEVESAGAKHTMPPRWFGIAISLCMGVLIGAASAGKTELVAVALLVMTAVIATRRAKLGASPKELPTGAKGIAAIIGLVVFAFALTSGGRVLQDLYGLSWAPIAGGGLMTITVYIFSVIERREYQQKIDQGRSK